MLRVRSDWNDDGGERTSGKPVQVYQLCQEMACESVSPHWRCVTTGASVCFVSKHLYKGSEGGAGVAETSSPHVCHPLMQLLRNGIPLQHPLVLPIQPSRWVCCLESVFHSLPTHTLCQCPIAANTSQSMTCVRWMCSQGITRSLHASIRKHAHCPQYLLILEPHLQLYKAAELASIRSS